MLLETGVVVVLHDPPAVAGIGQREIKDLRILHPLLKPVSGLLVQALGFHHGHGYAGSDFQDIVGPISFLPTMPTARRHDPPVGEVALFDDLLFGPPC